MNHVISEEGEEVLTLAFPLLKVREGSTASTAGRDLWLSPSLWLYFIQRQRQLLKKC